MNVDMMTRRLENLTASLSGSGRMSIDICEIPIEQIEIVQQFFDHAYMGRRAELNWSGDAQISITDFPATGMRIRIRNVAIEFDMTGTLHLDLTEAMSTMLSQLMRGPSWKKKIPIVSP